MQSQLQQPTLYQFLPCNSPPSAAIIAQCGKEGNREEVKEVKVVIEGTTEEIAALVRATQERQAVGVEVNSPIETIAQAVQQAIGDTAAA